MSRILIALYREPVLFAGVVVTLTTSLGAAEIIPVWIAPVVAAVGAVVTRHFTRPDQA
jgi:positive regulator of sigma E activity